MPQEIRSALERLLEVAHGNTDQSQFCANFLLAWWNASSCGGFDLTDLWKLSRLDPELCRDCITVFGFIAEHEYMDRFDLLGYTAQFQRVIDAWRPTLA